jgi:hypothetical protein
MAPCRDGGEARFIAFNEPFLLLLRKKLEPRSCQLLIILPLWIGPELLLSRGFLMWALSSIVAKKQCFPHPRKRGKKPRNLEAR